jgi:AraC-like DNA-binding protein
MENTRRNQSPISFYLPTEKLRPFVTSYYVVRTAGQIADRLHPEWGNIRFALQGKWTSRTDGEDVSLPDRSGLFGPTDRTSHFGTSAGLLLGIGLTPLGWARLIRFDASLYANGIVELGDTIGVSGDVLADALRADASDQDRVNRLDDVLTRRADAVPPTDPALNAVQSALTSGSAENVRELAEITALSERTLHRICSQVFGFGPKRLLKRQRFLRTLDLVRGDLDGPLTHFPGSEYYDQAHFIRDFQAFMDTTPKAYFNSPREVMRRVAEERRRTIGASFQALHEP